ncbi:MAG: hypothetical protein K6C14_01615 [Eubacterium sp.]|nr:hypothetical protein [Eubacterium sp.]
MLSLKKIFKLYEKNCNKIKSGNGTLYFKPSVPLPVQNKNIFKKAMFEKAERCRMRDRLICVPSVYEDILVSLYGNWKALPPEEDRKPSHFSLDTFKDNK